jgi:uncharacterized RDD family membrane protein YckC
MEPIRDQLNIDTPELVAIEMPLAGIGSRFIAILIDYLICGGFLLLMVIVAAIVIPALHLFSNVSANWAAGIFFLIIFLLQWGYFSLFEAFNSGRTPGKHAAKIRVIHQSGRGINFLESLARNLVRAIDWFPSFYAVGVIAMFASKRHQRLGDMVAGTLVVRDRNIDQLQWSGTSSRTITGPAFSAGTPNPSAGALQAGLGLRAGSQEAAPAPWGAQSAPGVWGGPPHLAVTLPAPALAKLSVSDLEVLEGFFSRRLDMDLTTRSSLANRIAAALCAKSGLEIAQGLSTETFLEAVAHQLREIGRMR